MLCVALLLCFHVVRNVYAYTKRIDTLTQLTALPTVESEPENRASYYLAAAQSLTVSAAYEPPPASKRRALEEIAVVLEGASVDEFLMANQPVLALMNRTYGLNQCRMPLLFGTGTWGGFEFRRGDALSGVGELMFWSSLQALDHGDALTACTSATAILVLGNDVASAGSFAQAESGIEIYAAGVEALELILTNRLLAQDVLSVLNERLPECAPTSLDNAALTAHHRDWSVLAHHDTSPTYISLIRALHLERIIDIRAYNLSQPGMSFDRVEELHTRHSLLLAGTATQQFLLDRGRLPKSMEDLVPEYLPASLPDATVPGFVVGDSGRSVEIVSPGDSATAGQRSLRFDLDELMREDDQGAAFVTEAAPMKEST